MKKTILIMALSLFIASCSNDETSADNCQQKTDEINLKYDKQIQQVKDNPSPIGIDYRQIGLLNQERNLKLETACN